MIKTKKNLKSFINLTENKKDNILKYIIEKEVSIRQAALDLNTTTTTIDKIFAERYSKQKKSRVEYHKEHWIKNKLK